MFSRCFPASPSSPVCLASSSTHQLLYKNPSFSTTLRKIVPLAICSLGHSVLRHMSFVSPCIIHIFLVPRSSKPALATAYHGQPASAICYWSPLRLLPALIISTQRSTFYNKPVKPLPCLCGCSLGPLKSLQILTYCAERSLQAKNTCSGKFVK